LRPSTVRAELDSNQRSHRRRVQAGSRAWHADELGYKVAMGKVRFSDLRATVLHQMGLDHETLTYHHSGRDETFTDSSLTGARVVHELFEA
jgi:hypothetical protein